MSLKDSENSIMYTQIFPIRRFPIVSLADIRMVLYKVGTSNVDDRVSASPKGIIGGIQPVQ